MDHGTMDHSNMDHSNMDHGDMDHGMNGHGGMDHGSMKMYFHFSNDAVILFAGWKTCNAIQMFGSCLVMIILASLYEGLKVVRDWLMKRSVTKRTNGKSVPVPTSEETVATTQSPSKHSVSLLSHLIQVMLHMIQVTVSYVLMLVFMTYNVWLCLSVVVGAGIGYLIFGRMRSSMVQDINEHCN